MTGHEPEFRAPPGVHGPSIAPGSAGDSTIETTPFDAAPGHLAPVESRESWVAGRIALLIAGVGLFGTALGAAWFGLGERNGFNPGGIAGMGLVLVAAAL